MTPSLTFRSEPALSTSQILALLLTGRVEVPTAADQERLQASANQQALSFLEGLSLGILQRQLGEDLPSELPVVSIEPGREGLSDARLRAGRQVADNVYVEYSHNLGAQSGQNTAQVRVQWRLTRRWSVESFFGDAGSGGVDVVYTFRY